MAIVTARDNILTSERTNCQAEFMLENPAISVSAWFSSYPLQASGREDKNLLGEAVLAGVDPDVGQDLEWKAAEYRHSH